MMKPSAKHWKIIVIIQQWSQWCDYIRTMQTFPLSVKTMYIPKVNGKMPPFLKKSVRVMSQNDAAANSSMESGRACRLCLQPTQEHCFQVAVDCHCNWLGTTDYSDPFFQILFYIHHWKYDSNCTKVTV